MLKDFILSKFPKNYEEMDYIEPCIGGGSIFLNKNSSKSEVINDLDKGIYNLFYHAKNNSQEFIDKVSEIEYSEESFKASFVSKQGLDEAVNELVRRRMSRGGLKKHFSWSERKRGGIPGDRNAWLTFIKELPLICERLQSAEITNKHVIDLVKEKDGENNFIYLDPPYLPCTRTVKKVYDVEMDEEVHIELAKVLQETKSKVLISGYFSGLYAKLFKGWHMEVKEVANHSSQSKNKERRLECLWMNYE